MDGALPGAFPSTHRGLIMKSPVRGKKKIKEGERVAVRLTLRQKSLLTQQPLSDRSWINRLNLATVKRDSIVVRCSLCELDLLLDDLSAAANHQKSRQLQKDLDALCEWIETVKNSYEEVEPS